MSESGGSRGSHPANIRSSMDAHKGDKTPIGSTSKSHHHHHVRGSTPKDEALKESLEEKAPAVEETSGTMPSATPSSYTGIQELHKYHHVAKDGVYCIQYAPDGNSLAIGFGDSALEIVNPNTGKIIKELHRHRYGAMVTMCTKFNPMDGNMLMATHGEGAVHCYNIETMTSKEILQEAHNEIYCMDFSCDGLYFATGGRGMDIFIYDVKSNRRLYTLAGYNTLHTKEDQGGHARRVFGLRFHPSNSDLLVSGGWDSHLKVWDLRQPDPKTARFISGPVVCGDSIDIKDGQILAGSWRHSEAVQLFDFASGRLIDTYPMITKTPAVNTKDTGGEYVYCARFCDNGIVLAGGSGTQSVQAIDTNTKKVIAEVGLGGNVQAMDVYGFGKQFAFGGMPLTVKICKMI